jgi:hypothetical protein
MMLPVKFAFLEVMPSIDQPGWFRGRIVVKTDTQQQITLFEDTFPSPIEAAQALMRQLGDMQ